jgi:hypothetical protein
VLNSRRGNDCGLVRSTAARVALTVLLLAALGLVIIVGTGHNREGAASPVFGTHSPSAAAATAGAVLALVELPPGARSLAHLSESRLTTLGYYGATGSSGVDRVGIWQLPISINDAATFLEHHAPTGLRYEEADVDVVANEVGTFGGTVSFQSRPIAGPANSTAPFTRVTYSLTAATGDHPPTDVVVGVQVAWEPLRTAAEDLPAGITAVEVTRIGFHLAKVEEVVSTHTVKSTSATVIARFAAIIDRLQPLLLGQPATCFSPEITASTTLYTYRLLFSGGSHPLRSTTRGANMLA